MKKIDEKNKTCIYLDQFVISDILDGENPLWLDFNEVLQEKYKEGKVYCPISNEHLLETSKKHLDDAKNHHDFLDKLSDNYTLKDGVNLTSQLISSLIRKNKKTINTFLIKHNSIDIENIYPGLNKVHDKTKSEIISKLDPIRDFCRILYQKNGFKNSKEFFELLKNHQTENFKSNIQEFIKLNFQNNKIKDFSSKNVHFDILYQLLNKHKFSKKHFDKLLSIVNTNGLENIPTMNINESLICYLFSINKKDDFGDFVDFTRISNYLFSSDIFFTDRRRKHEIKELGLDKKYKTKVFSGIKKDVIEVTELLKSL